MRKFLATILIASLAVPFVNGQDAPRRMVRVTPKDEEAKPSDAKKEPEATPTPKKRSLFQRLFGPLPTPTPIPRPTPTPTPIAKKRSRPKAPVQQPAEPSASAEPRPAPAPAPSKPKASLPKAPSNAAIEKGVDDPVKFKAAKAKAMEDASLKELRAKADSELNEAEAQKALSAYNRALFKKIREIDPSISDYATKVEESMSKRISSEKSQ